MGTRSNKIKIEADMYSGCENPAWYVDGDFVRKLVFSLQQCEGVKEQPGILGYRGVLIHLPEAEGGLLRCFNGFATNAYTVWKDEGRELEIALLNSGEGAIGAIVLRDLIG